MVEVRNVTKCYGEKKVISDISFTAHEFQVVGLLGQNGAGKSTLMNMITGFLPPTEGSVYIEGIDIFENPVAAKRHIGYLPEHPPLYLEFTVDEYLNFIFNIKAPQLDKKKHLDEVCQRTSISSVRNRLIRNLSKGYRQRVGIAQALIGNPGIIILDEPTAGLDPAQIIEIRSLVKSLGKSHIVFLSSHILSEVQNTCDRVMIINNGRIAGDVRTGNLSGNDDARCVLLSLRDNSHSASHILKAVKGIISVKEIKKEENILTYEITGEAGIDIRPLIARAFSGTDIDVLELYTRITTLEDIFIHLTTN